MLALKNRSCNKLQSSFIITLYFLKDKCQGIDVLLEYAAGYISSIVNRRSSGVAVEVP
jgi:hypothetical protein